MKAQDQMKSAFLGQAVCDAFAYPFEFRVPDASEMAKHLHGTGMVGVSDDTQMAMFGLEALIEATFTGAWKLEDGPEKLLDDFLIPRYVLWYLTQVGHKSLSLRERQVVRAHPSFLFQQPQMFFPRAPGVTCMGALSQLAERGSRSRNISKGNGAVMRSLPFLFLPDMMKEAEAPAATALASCGGAITHDHDESRRGVDLYMKLGFALKYAERRRMQGVVEYFAESFLSRGVGLFDQTYLSIHEWLNTGTAMGALHGAAWVLHTALESPGKEYEQIIRLSCQGGDADTVAAIAGGLLGLVLPPPEAMVNRVIERAIIEKLVDMAFPEDASSVRAPAEVQPKS